MSAETDALVRLGLALFRHSEVLEDAGFIPVQSLVFEQIGREVPRGLFNRLFGGKDFDFWGQQETLAKQLSATGLAEMYSRPIAGDEYKRDYFLKLTPLGRSLFTVASNAIKERSNVDQVAFEDIDAALHDANTATALAVDLRRGAEGIARLHLSNADISSAQSYVNMMIMIAEMPEPDTGLFWKILERLNQFAGVASLIVAIIALRLAK